MPGRDFPSPLRAIRAAAVFTVVLLVASILAAVSAPSKAEAASLPPSILEGGYIISDEEFFDGYAMDVADVQRFLNERVPACASGVTCLKSYRDDFQARAADRYCGAVGSTAGLSSARIIVRVARACGINARVILVMLEKEQGLVTSTRPTTSRYDRAMGFACPDTTGCDSRYFGFANQVYRGARQMQVYTLNPTYFNYKPGQVNTIKWHPNSACGTSQVYIQNRATANLYIYTPYRPNVAALAAGWGTGDKCSSYGNRNFYNYYEAWFEPSASSSNGAPAQVSACQSPPSADIASASGTATVTASALNARKAPTMVCSSGMTTLSKGTAVTVTGKYGMWTRGRTASGATVWLASEFLTGGSSGAGAGSADPCAQPASASIASASGTVTVTTGVLNVRKAPSVSCSTGRIQMTDGQTATRTGTYGDWWRLTVSGATYWAHSDFLTVSAASTDPCVVPSVDEVNAGLYVVRTPTVMGRRAPSLDCDPPLTVLTRGTSLRLFATDGDWYWMRRGSAWYWVHGDYVLPTRERSTTTALNLRQSPSTSSRSLLVLSRGTKVYIIADQGSWRKVIVGSNVGWVHAAYLR